MGEGGKGERRRGVEGEGEVEKSTRELGISL